MAMSATVRRSSRCSAWAWRSGRSTPCSSPTHPGYGHRTGQVFTGTQVRDIVDGIAARGVLGQCVAVLSGYLGDPAVGEAVLHAVAAVRSANPDALYCCDPVIGDTGPGRLCPARHPSLAAGSLPQAGRPCDPESVRSRAADGTYRPHPRRREDGRLRRCVPPCGRVRACW